MKVKGERILFYSPGDYLSPHHLTRFTVDNVSFLNFDQYIGYQKAAYFKDEETQNKIKQSNNMNHIMLMARRIQGVNEEEWRTVFHDIAYKGIYEKFKQNDVFSHKLVETGQKTLLNMSPYDSFWGTGPLKPDGSYIGSNHYGKILEEIRAKLTEAE